jgi:hypothetical protein
MDAATHEGFHDMLVNLQNLFTPPLEPFVVGHSLALIQTADHRQLSTTWWVWESHRLVQVFPGGGVMVVCHCCSASLRVDLCIGVSR